MKSNKTMTVRVVVPFFQVIIFVMVFWRCGTIQLTGGGSDTEVSGRILAATGEGANGAVVAIIATDFDPGIDAPLSEDSYDTADLQGNYHFDSVPAGVYNVWAKSPSGNEQVLFSGVSVVEERETRVNDVTLKPAAFIRLLLPDSLAGIKGRISVTGTLLSTETSGMNNVVELPAVPQGMLASIRFRTAPSDTPLELYTTVAVTSADTVTLNPFNEISGIIFESLQTAAGVTVTLIPAEYNPAFGAALPLKLSAVTGPDGVYRLYNIDQGSYNLYAIKGLKIFRAGVFVDPRQSIAIADVTIEEPATLVVPIPENLRAAAGYVYLTGTLSMVRCEAGVSVVRFDSLAQGTYARIVYQRSAEEAPVVLYTDVIVDSAGLFTLDPYMNWQHEARVTFNTTSTGANVSENVVDFPALIRLTGAEIDFSEARPEGEDLRFVRADHSLIPFEIEDWDSATATAVIWMMIDTVRGNSSVQNFRMLWGNASAKKSSQPALVFDTVQGFQGVWHLGESGPNNKLDATLNGFTGTPVELTGSSDVDGLAGRALDVDGSSQCVTVLDARDSRLDVQADSFYTVSAWVYLRNDQRDNRVIVSKGSAQYGLRVNEQNQWEFYSGLRGYGVDTTTASDATMNEWTFLTGIRKGMRQYLYVNGTVADSTDSAAGVSATVSGNYYDLVIGRQSDDESQWFDGLVDEVRVENRSRTAIWVRLCYESQRIDQKFVVIQKVR